MTPKVKYKKKMGGDRRQWCRVKEELKKGKYKIGGRVRRYVRGREIRERRVRGRNEGSKGS